MKKDLLEIICCPVCKEELTLKINKADGEEILEGVLECVKCHSKYPIEDGIPNLLPPE
ncbi:MAG: methytransferase partner Trm112 [Thermoplasmatales archaeon]|jgi:uncharacterized protein YbaR (Trm112 family)|nr:methytransferase partner Trm112 [Candidatus Thermoplasmatota archaeon]MDA8055334.1 methytransferase partner Trm112 [Thermoplasmatales archaeon]